MIAMKKIMILGAGPFQIAAIHKAQAMGLSVIACSNNPADPGIMDADIPYIISTTEKEQLLNVAKKEGISGIMTLGSDVSVPSVAYIAEKLNLPGISQKVALNVTDKGYFRQFLQQAGFPHPKFGVAKTASEACEILSSLNHPAIMKPVLSSGSRGVVCVGSPVEIQEFFSDSVASSFGRKMVVIEEFLDGREFGGEALVFGGEIVFFQITNKYINSFFVPTGHSMPSDLSFEIQGTIRTMIQNIVRNLEINTSPLNFDVKLTDNGPVLLEMGCRLGGNCLPTLMTLSTGIDTIANTIRVSVGETPLFSPLETPKCYRVIILGSPKTGILKYITPETEFYQIFPDSVVSVKYRYGIGDLVDSFKQGSNNLGYIVFKSKNLKETEEIYKKIIQRLHITVHEG